MPVNGWRMSHAQFKGFLPIRIATHGTPRRPLLARKKGRASKPRGPFSSSWPAVPAGIRSVLDEHAQARTGKRGGLAGHRLAQALTLERSGEVALAAAKEAGKEFHDTSPCIQGLHGVPSLKGVGQLVWQCGYRLCAVRKQRQMRSAIRKIRHCDVKLLGVAQKTHAFSTSYARHDRAMRVSHMRHAAVARLLRRTREEVRRSIPAFHRITSARSSSG